MQTSRLLKSRHFFKSKRSLLSKLLKLPLNQKHQLQLHSMCNCSWFLTWPNPKLQLFFPFGGYHFTKNPNYSPRSCSLFLFQNFLLSSSSSRWKDWFWQIQPAINSIDWKQIELGNRSDTLLYQYNTKPHIALAVRQKLL